MGMNGGQIERDHRSPLRHRPVEVELIDRRQLFDRQPRQPAVMLRDRLHADPVQVIHRRGESDRARDILGASLEFPWDVVPLRGVVADAADHVAPEQEGLHRLEMLDFGIEDPDAERPEHLVPGKDQKIGVESADIDSRVGYALGAVHQDERSGGMGLVNKGAQGIDRTEGIRDLGDGEQAAPFAQQPLQLNRIEIARLVEFQETQFGPAPLRRHLPGHQVAVVLQLGDDDLIALSDMALRPAPGDEIDRLGGVAGEDDLLTAAGADERGHTAARRLVSRRRPLSKAVSPAVGIGIIAPVKLIDRLEDLTGPVRRGRTVQINQIAVFRLREERKISAYFANLLFNLVTLFLHINF